MYLFAQMVCLEDWAMVEREHISSLAGAIGDLEANTLRLPLAGGTKVRFTFSEKTRKQVEEQEPSSDFVKALVITGRPRISEVSYVLSS